MLGVLWAVRTKNGRAAAGPGTQHHLPSRTVSLCRSIKPGTTCMLCTMFLKPAGFVSQLCLLSG